VIYLLQEKKLLSAPFAMKLKFTRTFFFKAPASRPSRVQYAPCTYVGLSLFCFCNCLLPAGFHFKIKTKDQIIYIYIFFYVFIWHKEEDINLLIYNTTLYSCIQSTYVIHSSEKVFEPTPIVFPFPKKKKHPLFFQEHIKFS
jgi:hypothetical protein